MEVNDMTKEAAYEIIDRNLLEKAFEEVSGNVIKITLQNINRDYYKNTRKYIAKNRLTVDQCENIFNLFDYILEDITSGLEVAISEYFNDILAGNPIEWFNVHPKSIMTTKQKLQLICRQQPA